MQGWNQSRKLGEANPLLRLPVPRNPPSRKFEGKRLSGSFALPWTVLEMDEVAREERALLRVAANVVNGRSRLELGDG